jgi:hypothetical protein
VSQDVRAAMRSEAGLVMQPPINMARMNQSLSFNVAKNSYNSEIGRTALRNREDRELQ